MKKTWVRILLAVLLLLLIAVVGRMVTTKPSAQNGTSTTQVSSVPVTEKPVIYLYPETPLPVTVTLTLDGTLGTAYPAPDADGAWRVTAYPDGTLEGADGREYSYLFWDGTLDTAYDFSEGFCVAGEDTAAFLQETLAAMGMTPREYNEMIVYWLPKMEHNAYNLISFQSDAYTDAARLTVEPAPDSLLRVFMAWKPLTEPTEIEPQTFTPFTRNGFTAVEWGGTEVK
ncbi:MAG: hypothetical protein VB111_09930 [Clostridiaceae bacterium]|nr:hypothetical protein [Clostridiaceae bacterium]